MGGLSPFDLAAGQGLGTRLGEKKARRCHANRRCRSPFAPPWHTLLNLQTKTHRGRGKKKKRKEERTSNSLPTHLISQGHSSFPRTGKGAQRYLPKGVSIVSSKGFLTRKQVGFFRKNIYGSPSKSFGCGTLLFPAAYQRLSTPCCEPSPGRSVKIPRKKGKPGSQTGWFNIQHM